MFNVGTNWLPPPLSGLSPGTLPGSGPAAGAAYGGGALAGDGISAAPQPPSGAASPGMPWFGNGPGGYIAQFMSTIFAAFTQMAQYLTSAFGQPPWGGGQNWFPPVPGSGGGPRPFPAPQPNGGGPGQGEHAFFTSAQLSSTGDPHDAFDGTTGSGQTIGGRWNSMVNHPDLLDSSAFAGGFRVSTNVSSPNEHGISHNEEATVETNYGHTAVTMYGNGSYSVTEGGKPVELEVGQSKDLGNGESVTLNADHSLTVTERSTSGGEIATTLVAENGHVNVRASAHDVELGGYLVRHAEDLPSPATAPEPRPQPFAPWPLSGSPQPQPFQPYQPYQPYSATQGPAIPEMPALDPLLGA